MTEIDWSNPKNYNPMFIGFSFQMAAVQLMMKPQNQLALWRAMMNPSNYVVARKRDDG